MLAYWLHDTVFVLGWLGDKDEVSEEEDMYHQGRELVSVLEASLQQEHAWLVHLHTWHGRQEVQSVST